MTRTAKENLRIIREKQPELLEQMTAYTKIWPTLPKAERYRDWMYYRLVFKFKRRLDKRLEEQG